MYIIVDPEHKYILVDPENKYMNSKIYHLRGYALAKENKHLEAIEDFTKSVELDRLYTKAYHSR